MLKLLYENFKIILLVIIILIFAIGKFGAKLSYFSVSDIIKNYFICFRKKGGKGWLILPILNYTLAPILLGVVAALYRQINGKIINIITIVISIIATMLFTMLTMVIDMKAKINKDKKYFRSEYEISREAIVETYYVLMYEILINVVLLILCLFSVYTKIYNCPLSCVIYSLSFLMIFNIFMIIKRIYRIIDTDIQKE